MPIRRDSTLMVLACLVAATAAQAADTRAVNLRMPRFAAPVKGPNFSIPSGSSLGGGGGGIDFNGDGIAEIVQPISNYPGIGTDTPVPIRILGFDKRTGAYKVQTSRFLDGAVPKQVHSRRSEIGDFNGDGKADYFLGGHGWDAPPFGGEHDWLMLSRVGQKHYAVEAEPKIDTYTHASASGDIDLDGSVDIYVGILSDVAPLPYFLMGHGGGEPTVADDRLNDIVGQGQQVYVSAAMLRANDDDSPDLVLGPEDGAGNVVYLNDGTGHFTSAAPDITLPQGLFAGISSTLDIVAIDANTDGRDDILLLETKSEYAGYGLQLLIGNGSDFVDESTRFKNGSGLWPDKNWRAKVWLADFYGDGIQDIITTGFSEVSDPGYMAWINDGSGVFTPKARSLYTKQPFQSISMLYPVDFNKDGRTDLVDMGWSGPTSVYANAYRNLGPGTSGTPTKAQIVRPPQDETFTSGRRFLLSASVRGTRPLRFQWFRNGVAVPGATEPVFIKAATPGDAGSYKLRIKNAAGTVFTAPVTVTIN